MQRRSCLQTMLAACAGVGHAAAQQKAPAAAGSVVVLHVDLAVDPAREREMLRAFHSEFQPEARKHEGFVDVKMLKLKTAVQGAAPAGLNYRFQLTWRSEELRQQWVASEGHQRVWPLIAKTVKSSDFTVLLFDAK